jgi:hypothetical protein
MAKKKLTEIEHKIKKHQLPEVNLAFQNTVSYSQYSIYKTCPHQWYLTYIEHKLPPFASIHTTFGTSFHETLQHYITVMYNESKTAANRIDLEEYFKTRFSENYTNDYKNIGKHFSSPKEMSEFYEDAVAILSWVKKHTAKIFTTKNVRLLGIELPLLVKIANNLYYKAFIDFITYDEDTNKIHIYDIKTSTRGWSDNEKKKEIKLHQVILYKEYFAKQYDTDVENIEVEFIIVKRKIYEKAEYPPPRVQMFAPASGKTKRKQALESFQEFIKNCFDELGKHQIKSYIKNVGKSSCKWCPYRENKELCNQDTGLL